MENRLIDKRLDVLRDKLLLLGGATETALRRTIRALNERDSELARQLIKDDKKIDKMEVEIDQLSIEILALQQPAAYDLRFVIAVAKITPILERIADHAANIAEAVIIINNQPEVRPYAELSHMANTAAEMLNDALNAFTSEDAAASRKVYKRDKEINKNYGVLFDKLLTLMLEDTDSTEVAAHLMFVAKHLERIGDYVKDICEMNVYLTEAAFIKHKKIKK
ncbi:MAG: phosphate signaling complex protein PhoU [Pyrinomonadaceae bacterium]